MINLTTVSEALKVLYINPIREFVNMQADPFASRILQTSDNIVGYQKIVRAVQIGANGGAGAGTETGLLPVAGENLYKQFESDMASPLAAAGEGYIDNVIEAGDLRPYVSSALLMLLGI